VIHPHPPPLPPRMQAIPAAALNKLLPPPLLPLPLPGLMLP
jgi:hypothetical protein